MAHTLLLVDDEEKVLEFMEPFLRQEGLHGNRQNGPGGPAEGRGVKTLPRRPGLDASGDERHRRVPGAAQKGPDGHHHGDGPTEETDKIIGLEVGADDYITKPFSLRELAARIRAVLRRIEGDRDDGEALRRGDLLISEPRRRVWKRGKEIPLTPMEFKLLLTLAARPGIVYSRMQLLESLDDALWNDERTVDAHISRLRKKIEDDPANPVYIQTVYGFGYRFGDPA